ncbi:MAG: ClpP-like prohead protease/major capsid protein fusion protein [Dehalococcoidia bacterium]
MSTAKWYSIRARGVRAAEVYIYGDIGESWWAESVTAAEFVKEIAALDVDELTVRINSFGGSVSDGLAMYNALKRHKAAVTVSIDGIAASIASLVAMAGDTVEMADNALLMVHAPWGGVLGNATDMREFADLLDKHSQAMATSYSAKTGRDQAEMLALLTDGQDHWYTAAEAQAEKFVDVVSEAIPIAAHMDLSRFRSLPAAAAAFHSRKDPAMKDDQKKPAGTQPEPAPQPVSQPIVDQPNEAEISARALTRDSQRRTEIAARFEGFAGRDGVAELLAACQNDTACTLDDARSRLLAHLAKDVGPIGGSYVVTTEDERDKFRAGAVEAILARAATRDAEGKPVRVSASNPFRGHSLLDLARACLVRAGVRTDGMSKMDIVGAAFTQSTSDFPVLLENTMHKTLLQAYALQPNTWSRFCKIGSVSDFRAHPRYRVGSLGNLDTVGENAEYTNKEIPDGEKASITARTKGNIINVSRQMIVNDDLGAFTDLAAQLGRAANRTVEADVYAMLALNSGMGPTMADSVALFASGHANVTADGAMSVTILDGARSLMASQMDISGNDYLDIRPAVLVCPTASGGLARVLNSAEYDPSTANKLHMPNMVRGLFREVVDTPRLSGTRFYCFADPSEAPVFEVAFLDGVQEPYLELQNGFDVDGGRYKVRLDYGVAALDYRGATTSKGA